MNKKRMMETFKRLIEIDSVSGDEARIHDFLKQYFKTLGLEVTEDQSREKTGLGANNLIARLRGKRDVVPLLFSAHTDTVEPGKGIKMIEKNGHVYSQGMTILGADDKAGIAIMLEAIQRIQEEKIETGEVEFILSPGEEVGLLGAAALDMNLIKARMGYVLDSEGAVGRVTTASPTLYMYEVTITGKAAHAGIEINKGISALNILQNALNNIRTGQIDKNTTANIGFLEGGKAANIVMESLLVKGEVRAIDPMQAESLIQEMRQAFEIAASKYNGKVKFHIKKMATGYNLSEKTAVMKLLSLANNKLENKMISETSGGGSDANIFNEHGKQVVNLSIGYKKIHTTEETIAIDEIEKATCLVIELIKNAPRSEG